MSSVRIVREDPTGLRFAHAPMVGLVFIVIGSAMIYFGLHRLQDDTLGRWMFGGMGVLFAIIGALAMLWRYELTLDLMTRSYRGRRGFWPFPKVLQGSLDELRGIAIERSWRRSSSSNGGSSDHPTWVLLLDFGEWSVRIFESHREDKAYAKLEHLARRLQVHALDRTGDTETRRAWHELDRSVAESLQAKGERVADPGSPPPHSGILWEPASGVGSIVLPAVGFSRATVALIFFGILFAAFGVVPLAALSGLWDIPYSGSRVAGWVVGVLFCLIGLFLMFGAVWGSYAREVVREERHGLLFYLVLLGRRHRRHFLPKHEIEEVGLKPIATARSRRVQRSPFRRTTTAVTDASSDRAGRKHEIVVRADDELVKIGADLDPEGQAWLLRALTHLASR